MEAQISGTLRGDVELAAWLASGGLDGIDRIVGWHLELTDAGAQELAIAGCATLAEVDLSWNAIGAAGAAALVTALPRLTWLRLYHNRLGVEGAEAIASSGSLDWLNVCGNQLGDEGVAALCCKRLRGMRELALGYNDIGDAGARTLAAGAWPVLEFLNIRANQLGPAGAASVMELPALRRLGIDENALGDDGVAALIAGPRFGQLEWLNLGGTELDDGAVARIAAARPARLRALCVHDNDISDRAIAELRAALPGCEVTA